MSDLQSLLGAGTATGDQQSQDQGGDGQQGKPKRNTPKPDWVKKREQATGITATFSDQERRWVFPGLSTNMGGPKKGQADVASNTKKGGPMTEKDVQAAKNAPPSLDSASEDFLRGGYQDAWDKLQQLEKTDPKIKDDPKYKRLRKHVEIELNIG